MSSIRNLILAAVAALIAANSLADTPVYASVLHQAPVSDSLGFSALATGGLAIADLNGAALTAVD